MSIGPGGGQGDTVEIEWQFDALDLRPVGRWLAALAAGSAAFAPLGPITAMPKPTVVQDDLYLDTEDWRIAQAGYVLRVRHSKHKQEVTLKGLEPAAGDAAPRRRREVNEPFADPEGRWVEHDGPVGWRVRALIGRRPLHQILEVQTRRRPFVLRIGEEEVAEIALDETAIPIDDQNPMRLLRVEVEVQGPWVEALKPLVDDLKRAAGLSSASLSKFEAGVLARGYVIPARVNLGSTAVSEQSSIGALADAVIRRQLGVLLEHESGTRLGEDPEELHDMRVASRRLRAAIDLFAEVLPPQFTALAPELKWLAEVLGSVRDLDVQLERLDDSPEWHGPWATAAVEPSPVEELRAVFGRERDAARAVLLQALESPRYERLTTGLLALAQQGGGQRSVAGHLPATAVAPGLVERRHRAAVKAARRARRSGEPHDFHRLRIRCKRLRYALEFVQPLYGEPARQFARRLAKLQDLLGGVQDGQVAMERLHALALRAQPPLSRAAVFLMGSVAEEARREAARLQAKGRSRAKALRGEEWQHLAHTLERMRMDDDPEGHGGGGADGPPILTQLPAPGPTVPSAPALPPLETAAGPPPPYPRLPPGPS
jgi:triphosphatase